jgi:hypothetical protein
MWCYWGLVDLGDLSRPVFGGLSGERFLGSGASGVGGEGDLRGISFDA